MIQAKDSLIRPDVIILTKMDIGMARRGNVHTVRKLAFELGMNSAWGLEYVELTNGNAKEQAATEGMDNSVGLTGNAILTKCKLFDPRIVRDPLGEEHSSSELRLGGRMGVFARVGTSKHHLIAGSVHKITTHGEELTAYFDKYPPSNRLGIVIGGEQGNSFCAYIELKTVGSQEAGTLKANCLENITGTSRVDNFCSDMEVIGDETSSHATKRS